MEDSERVSKMKKRAITLLIEEPDEDLVHYILVELTEAKMAREQMKEAV